MLNVVFPETDLIGCKFPDVTGRNGDVKVDPLGKEYIYKLLPGAPRPHKGDLAVVSCKNGFQVCVVTQLDVPTTTFKDIAYVVGVISAEKYQAQLQKEALKERMYKDILAKKKEIENQISWDVLAERSPEFKAMVEAYRAL